MVDPSVSASTRRSRRIEYLRMGPVSAIGFGAMGLSYLYGAAKTDKESREVVKLVGVAFSSV